jgi:hypothetical protein
MIIIENLESLVAALIFSAIFYFGGTLRLPEGGHHRRLLSFGAGVSVAYVFVHLLPDLETARVVFVRSTSHISLPFRDLSVNLAAMTGFLAFYSLENMVVWSKNTAGKRKGAGAAGGPVFWLHIGGLAVSVWLISYLRIRNIDEGTVPLALYTAAMGLHFLAMDYALSREHGKLYERVGRKVLAASSILGWAVGAVAELPLPGVVVLFGFVAGAVMMNSMIMELPREKEGRLGSFLLGGLIYTALILLLR